MVWSALAGKYIKLQYGPNWRLGGARTLPFLLEKSRLVHQEQNERNYHVFYQLCKGVSWLMRCGALWQGVGSMFEGTIGASKRSKPKSVEP